MIDPIIAANIAAINTAPAAISLITFIFGFCSRLYKSHTFSIAELIASREITSAEISKIINHSFTEIQKKIPAKQTTQKTIR